MAKTDFEKNVDAMGAEVKAQQAEAERAQLEDMIGILGEIITKVSPGMADADYAIANIPNTAPGMTALRQARQAVTHTLGGEFQVMQARLAELQAESAETSDVG